MQVFNSATGQWEDDGNAPVPPSQTANPYGGAPPVANVLAPPGVAAPGVAPPTPSLPGGLPPVDAATGATPAPAMRPPSPDMLTKDLTSSGGSRTKVVESAAEKKLVGEMGKTQAEHEAAIRQQGGLNQQAAGEQATAAAERARIEQAHAAERQRVADEQNKVIAAKQAEHDAKAAQYSKTELKDFWADKSTGQKVAAAFAVALSGLGNAFQARAGMGAGKNGAMEVLNKAVEDDRQLQLQRIAKMRDDVAMARTGIADAREAKRALIEDTEAKYSAARAKIETDLAARMSKLLPDQAAVNTNADLVKLRESNNEKELTRVQGLRDHVTSTWSKQQTLMDPAMVAAMRGGASANPALNSEYTGKAASDKERENDAFATRMATSFQDMYGGKPPSKEDIKAYRAYLVEQDLAERNPKIDYAAKLVGLRKSLEQRLSPEGRRFFGAFNEFAGANLRKESGAAISPKEVMQLGDRILPAPGDTPEDTKRKRETARQLTLGTARQSHRPTFYEQQLNGGGQQTPTAQAPQTGGVRIKLKNGMVGIKYPDGTFEPEAR